jgi:hypothetical protein
MTIDLYGTRSMLRALDERRAPKRFFSTRFFTGPITHVTQAIDIDIRRNKRRLAPFVHPLAEGKLVERQGFRTETIKPPYIKEKMPATAVDMVNRQFGEPLYSNITPGQRIANQAAQDLAELQDMIDRRVEWMCASAMFNDSITVTGEGLNAVIDFGRATANDVTLTSGDQWDETTATPVQDIRAWKTIVTQATGLVPDQLVLGRDAAQAFSAHDEVVELLNRPVQSQIVVTMDTANLEDGVTYVGRVEGVDIWTFEEWYLDDNGVEQPLVPVDKALLAVSAPRARREIHYGAILDLDAGGLAAVPYWPKSWRVPDPSVQWVMLQSAPLPVPTQVDASLVADVV